MEGDGRLYPLEIFSLIEKSPLQRGIGDLFKAPP